MNCFKGNEGETSDRITASKYVALWVNIIYDHKHEVYIPYTYTVYKHVLVLFSPGNCHMRHRDRTIKSVGELIRAIRERPEAGRGVWYRGQADRGWTLTPSLARDPAHPDAEITLLKRFKQNALPHLTAQPNAEWEWLFLMQHYRVPTRLLDWSESPLAGLWFVVNEDTETDGVLWCLDPVALNGHARISFRFDLEIPAFGHDQIMENYLPSRIASETTSELSPVAAIGPRNSPRIAAQLGAFTITHRSHTPIEEVGDQQHVWRLIVPATEKSRIREELALLRYTRLTLFPELDSVADDAIEVLP